MRNSLVPLSAPILDLDVVMYGKHVVAGRIEPDLATTLAIALGRQTRLASSHCNLYASIGGLGLAFGRAHE
jgi:hypothetical protein